MFPRNEPNNRSVLNASYVVNDELGLIGIYGTESARIICIESGAQPNRVFYAYTIDVESGTFVSSDLVQRWKKSTARVDDQRSLAMYQGKDPVIFQKEFQAAKKEIMLFTKSMDDTMQSVSLNGEQDDDINRALRAIDQEEIVFKKEANCTLL